MYPASELGGNPTWDDARALMILSGNSTAVLTNTTCTVNNLGGEVLRGGYPIFKRSGRSNREETGGAEEDMTISLETSKTDKEDQNWIFQAQKVLYNHR